MQKQVTIVGVVLVVMFLLSADAMGQGRGKRNRGKKLRQTDTAPKVGDPAPLFKLKSNDGKSVFDLRSFRGEKPVVLLFGSYT